MTSQCAGGHAQPMRCELSVKQRPVCASDGRTYSSKCAMRLAYLCPPGGGATGGGAGGGTRTVVRVVHKGRCPGETRCEEERRGALNSLALARRPRLSDPGSALLTPSLAPPGPAPYVPQCGEGGAFLPTQCHSATGYCWCVSVDGRPISGSSVHSTNLTCAHRHGKGSDRSAAGASQPIKQRRGVARQCRPAQRASFASNLIKLFDDEFKRAPRPPTPPSHTRGQRAAPGGEVVAWKFAELDVDGDGALRGGELTDLRYMASKLVPPRPCALTFHTHCDPNTDLRIDLSEWTACLRTRPLLGGDTDSEQALQPADAAHQSNKALPKQPRPGDARGQGLGPRPRPLLPPGRLKHSKRRGEDGERRKRGDKAPSSQQGVTANSFLALISRKSPDRTNMAGSFSMEAGESHEGRLHAPPGSSPPPRGAPHGAGRVSCEAERARARALDAADPSARIFVPECEGASGGGAGGGFRRAQCHNATGYCWCVDPGTGVPLPGPSTHNTPPNCSLTDSATQRGCPQSSRRRFLTELLDRVTQDMVERINNGTFATSHAGAEPDPEQTIEERAVRWKLSVLDTNHNLILERHELKVLREELKEGRREDSDKQMRKCRRHFLDFCDSNDDSLISLAEWVHCIVPAEPPQSGSAADNPNRRGPNPFSTVLKS